MSVSARLGGGVSNRVRQSHVTSVFRNCCHASSHGGISGCHAKFFMFGDASCRPLRRFTNAIEIMCLMTSFPLLSGQYSQARHVSDDRYVCSERTQARNIIYMCYIVISRLGQVHCPSTDQILRG